MATIPQATDYGARQSLRTNRLDLPGTGELAISEAIAVAADTFGKVIIEHKVKTDAFNYAMAIKEYQTDDLAEREKLKDDREYEKFDEKYLGGMKLAGDRITKKYKMPSTDRAVFDAETDLIRARGRASVQDYRRALEIDHKIAQLDGALELVKEEVLIAPPGEGNALLITALDLINAAEEQRFIDETPAQRLREDLVQAVSKAKLEKMDPKERAEILRGSLKYRTERGPITIDKIRKGEGTGYIADFLHTDTAAAMLEATEKELEIDTAQAEGYVTNDQAWVNNPGLGSDAQRARMKEIKDAGLSSEARKAAEAANARRTLMEANIRQEGWREADEQLKVLIDNGAAWEETPGALRAVLPPDMHKTRKAYAIAARAQEDFPSVTSSEAIEAYAALTLQEQIEWSPDNWMVTPPLLDAKRWGDHVTRKQADLWTSAGGQFGRAVEAGRTPEKGLTPTQLLENVFLLVMKKPTAASDKATHQKWARLWLAYNNAAILLGGTDTLTPEARVKLAMEIIQFEVYVRNTIWDDEGINFSTMSQDQIERSYLKLDEPAPPFGFTAFTMKMEYDAIPELELPAFNGMAIDWLKDSGSTVNPIEQGLEPTQKVLEEAWFYLVTAGPGAALNRLRGLPGY